jgi:hypothetical protein
MSHANLTGYEVRREEAAEVYVYDAAGAGRLSCASCNPSGEPAVNRFVSAWLPPSYSNTFMPRWISEDGTRVFFVSLDGLVPQDTNGLADVYEWEQQGAGDCQSGGGCIYLLSGGKSPDNSYLVDASVRGDDVFIVTRAQLTPLDVNENFDIYDVRVNAVQQSAAAVCADVFCEDPGAAAPGVPVFGSPASSTFSGAGNLALPPPVKPAVKPKHKPVSCKQGSVRRGGKCVKKKTKTKTKRARRSAKGRK